MSYILVLLNDNKDLIPRNVISLIFSKQIICDRLLLTNRKSNFSGRFKLESITTYMICYESIVKML